MPARERGGGNDKPATTARFTCLSWTQAAPSLGAVVYVPGCLRAQRG